MTCSLKQELQNIFDGIELKMKYRNIELEQFIEFQDMKFELMYWRYVKNTDPKDMLDAIVKTKGAYQNKFLEAFVDLWPDLIPTVS